MPNTVTGSYRIQACFPFTLPEVPFPAGTCNLIFFNYQNDITNSLKIQPQKNRCFIREMNQSQAAEPAGITYRYWSDIENGRKNPGLDKIFKIADVLGVDVSHLFEKH